MFGGQIANVEMVEGLEVRATGMMLAMNLMQQSMGRGVKTITGEVSTIASVDGKFLVGTPDGGYTADSVIVASGGSLRTLRVPGEDKFIGRGVSQCASCDGPLYQGDDVIVVGGGDAAAQEALSLSNVCRSVTMICRSGLRARSHYVGRIEANKAISVMSNHVVLEILGEGRRERARPQQNRHRGQRQPRLIQGHPGKDDRVAMLNQKIEERLQSLSPQSNGTVTTHRP